MDEWSKSMNTKHKSFLSLPLFAVLLMFFLLLLLFSPNPFDRSLDLISLTVGK